jgi:hypothetical protein
MSSASEQILDGGFSLSGKVSDCGSEEQGSNPEVTRLGVQNSPLVQPDRMHDYGS